MLQVKPEDRATVDDVLSSFYFDEVREMKGMPPFTPDEQKLHETIQDFITRDNVHKFSGEEEFTKNFDEKIRPSFSQISKSRLDNVFECALLFIFDKDP